MKRLIFLVILILCFISCKKEEFNINDPDVEVFVNQLKSGTYRCFEKGEKGENLWLAMPKFTEKHIQSLIHFSKDTTHIANYPINPLSSRRPFPEGRDYFILGECLLWTVEGIRNGRVYGSLDPFLIDADKPDSERMKGLKCSDILIIRDLYIDWWNAFEDSNWKDKNPLDGKSYRWF